MPSHALCVLSRFHHTFCFYAASSAVFFAPRVFPHTKLAFRPSFSASKSPALRPFLAAFWLLKSCLPMRSAFCLAFITRYASILLLLSPTSAPTSSNPRCLFLRPLSPTSAASSSNDMADPLARRSSVDMAEKTKVLKRREVGLGHKETCEQLLA